MASAAPSGFWKKWNAQFFPDIAESRRSVSLTGAMGRSAITGCSARTAAWKPCRAPMPPSSMLAKRSSSKRRPRADMASRLYRAWAFTSASPNIQCWPGYPANKNCNRLRRAAIRQRQRGAAHHLGIAGRNSLERLVAQRFERELFENLGKRFLGAIGIAFRQEKAIVQATIEQGSDDHHAGDRSKPHRLTGERFSRRQFRHGVFAWARWP